MKDARPFAVHLAHGEEAELLELEPRAVGNRLDLCIAVLIVNNSSAVGGGTVGG